MMLMCVCLWVKVCSFRILCVCVHTSSWLSKHVFRLLRMSCCRLKVPASLTHEQSSYVQSVPVLFTVVPLL